MKQMRQTHLFFDTLIVSPKRKHIKYLYYILCHTLKAYLFKVYSAIMNPIRKLTFFNIYGGCNQGGKHIRAAESLHMT